MPGYGISRGSTYSSSHHGYNPLRGNNKLNSDLYSSLHYKSNRNYSQPQSNHSQSNHPQSSLHSGSNPCTNNPYLILLNKPTQNPNLPDLSAPRRPPQPIATPPRPNRPKQTQSTNGWNFSFSYLKSAWTKLIGTPSKSKPPTSRRLSMSQPPHSPVHQPPNPYRTTDSIPETRPVTAPHPIKPSLQIEDTEPIIDDPHTPPLQTRATMSNFLSQASSNTENDDAKSANNTRNDGSAVISIHNLLQKTKLSPDDAAWLHSKIDQVTHDRYDGSLSYIGPVVRANSQSLVQHLSFDDSATEASYKSQHSIYSPLRSNRTNVIPHTTKASSRYAPHPPSFHVSSRVEDKAIHTNYIRRRGKRPREAVFNDDDEPMNGYQQRKKMRLSNKSIYLRKRAFKDNYLRPIGAMHSSVKIVPKYNEIETKTAKKDDGRKEEKKEISIKDKSKGRNGFCFPNHDTTTNVLTMRDDLDVKRNNGSYKPSENVSEELSSENVIMDVDIKGNKPLKRRQKKRSPLKDKKLDNCLNKIQKQAADKDNDDDDDDDDDLHKMKSVNDENLDDENIKKKNVVSPKSPKSPKNGKIAKKMMSKTSPKRKKKKSAPSTPISKAFNIANDMVINHKKTVDIHDNTPNQEQKTDSVNNSTDDTETPTNEDDTKPESSPNKATENESEKGEGKTNKPPIKKNGSYMMMIMTERKERYITGYTERLRRIYEKFQPSKLDKVEGFITKYGVDADKIHGLYSKICAKYALKPFPKYEGSKHELDPHEEGIEGPIEVTPEQNLSQNLNDDIGDKVENTKKESGFTFNRESEKVESFALNKDSNDNNSKKTEEKKEDKKNGGLGGWSFSGFGTEPNEKNKATPTFDNAPNPFGSTDNKNAPNPFGSDNKKSVTDNKNAPNPFGSTDNKNAPNPFGCTDKKKSVTDNSNAWNDNKNKDLFSKPAMQFSVPSGMSFSGGNKDNSADHQNKDDKNNKGMFSNTNDSFKFNNTSPPSLGVNTTEIIEDNNTKNDKKRGWDFDGTNSGFSWNKSKKDKVDTKPSSNGFSTNKGNAPKWGFNANTKNNENKSQNNGSPWNNTAKNDNKTPWNNKPIDTSSVFNNNTPNNNNSAFTKNNNSSFGWGNKSNNNSNGFNNNNSNGFNTGFQSNNNSNNAGNGGWNNNISNNNTSSLGSNGNGFTFAPTNGSSNTNVSNNNNNSKKEGFFTMGNNNNGKRRVVKAKRRFT